MSDPFVAEIRIFGFNFAPAGWAQCNGQLMPISQNTALFSLLGTNYGGDGRSTFALPNLQNSAAIDAGQGPGLSPYFPGQQSGAASVTLLQAELPGHGHSLAVSGAAGSTTSASNAQLHSGKISAGGKGGATTTVRLYSPTPAQATTGLAATAIATAGGNLPHNNMMPYVGINFCIALQGIFPPRA